MTQYQWQALPAQLLSEVHGTGLQVVVREPHTLAQAESASFVSRPRVWAEVLESIRATDDAALDPQREKRAVEGHPQNFMGAQRLVLPRTFGSGRGRRYASQCLPFCCECAHLRLASGRAARGGQHWQAPCLLMCPPIQASRVFLTVLQCSDRCCASQPMLPPGTPTVAANLWTLLVSDSRKDPQSSCPRRRTPALGTVRGSAPGRV